MVQAGEKLKKSKKKAKMASATSSSRRDWGKVRHIHPFLSLSLFPTPHCSCSSFHMAGHGMCGPHQRVYHCACQPFRAHPWCPCGYHVALQSPGMLILQGSRHFSIQFVSQMWLGRVQVGSCLEKGARLQHDPRPLSQLAPLWWQYSAVGLVCSC